MTGERGNRLLSIEVLDTTTGTWTTSDVEMPVGVASFEMVADRSADLRVRRLRRRQPRDGLLGRPRHPDRGVARPAPAPARPLRPHRDRLRRAASTSSAAATTTARSPRSTSSTPQPETLDHRWTPMAARARLPRDGRHARRADRRRRLARLRATATWSTSTTRGPVRWSSGSPTSRSRCRAPGSPTPRARCGSPTTSLRTSLDGPTPGDVGGGQRAARSSRHGMGFVVLDGVIYSIGGCALNPLRDVRTVDRHGPRPDDGG